MTIISSGKQKRIVESLRALAQLIEDGEYGQGDNIADRDIAEAIQEVAGDVDPDLTEEATPC